MKNILVLNVGSSSIKYATFVADGDHLQKEKEDAIAPISSVCEGIDSILETQRDTVFDTIGFRVVHGGSQFFQPTVITEDVFSSLQETKELAPLHNPYALEAIIRVKETRPNARLVAVFDTMFHHTMPPVARHYGIAPELAREYGIYRYGFHGIAHACLLDAYVSVTGTPHDEACIITVQLGSGCSVCAIKNGQSVDCSMGFSPLEGLIGRTRSGDIDPSIIPYLSTKMNISAAEVIQLFNTNAGLAGMTNTSGDMREVQKLMENGDQTGQMAWDMFCYRIKKYLGAFDGILGSGVPIVFGGGMSEHGGELLFPSIFAGNFLGGVVKQSSVSFSRPVQQISTPESSRAIFVARIDEQEKIARELVR